MNKRLCMAYGIYVLVALAVLLPMLKPGFILTLDMVFVPTLRMPDAVTSSYVFHAGLHVLNFVLPADIIQKLLLTCILLLSSIGLHRLVRLLQPNQQPGEWGIYIASIFYAINPFTYSRFMAGQYAVLLGYALLPWLVRLLIAFDRQPDMRAAVKVGALLAIIGIVSIHTLGSVVILVITGMAIVHSQRPTTIKYTLAALGVFVLLSSYWLVPLAFGRSQTAHTIQSFTAADTAAFASTGTSVLARSGNIARLQGFWAEGRDLFLLPQDQVALWGLMALLFLALVATGGMVLWRRHPAIVLWLVVSMVLAAALAAGVFSTILTSLGFREPHKLVALVALGYSVFLAFGSNAFLSAMQKKSSAVYTVAAVLIVLLPFAFMRGMFWGFNGQLVPRHYPTQWAATDQMLQQDSDNYRVLFLPWHQYMSFQFAGRIIANPAPQYFSKSVLMSTDPELGGAASGKQTADQVAIEKLLTTKNDVAPQLANRNIKYIVLAHEVDWRKYDFLTRQPGIQPIYQSNAITLFANHAWEGQ
ncbi:MAG TPA: hypothetical protein VMY99_03290 [Nevskiaceae bacterium]|nr:hypothetical protein [Nevskiaceae bacterium]